MFYKLRGKKSKEKEALATAYVDLSSLCCLIEMMDTFSSTRQRDHKV